MCNSRAIVSIDILLMAEGVKLGDRESLWILIDKTKEEFLVRSRTEKDFCLVCCNTFQSSTNSSEFTFLIKKLILIPYL